VVPRLSREALRHILHETTTTWKASTDPDFLTKMHRILALYDTPPADERVICVEVPAQGLGTFPAIMGQRGAGRPR